VRDQRQAQSPPEPEYLRAGLTPSVAVMTMTRDEADMLPRWLDYYGRQVGVDNLVVLDDHSTDGSTADLPCTVHRLPPPPLKYHWRVVRNHLVNHMSRALLAAYDVVIFTDVDEFLVPDPDHHDGLLGYLSARADKDLLAPVAVNVLHNARLEPDLDPTQPLLSQRRFVKFAPEMCKPLVKRAPAWWTPGFHGAQSPFEVDRELLMLHLKFYDVPAIRRVAGQRHEWHTSEGRGSAHSAWSTPAEELVTELASWVETDAPDSVPEFDLHEPDLTKVLEPTEQGGLRAKRRPRNPMRDNPLRVVPKRFQHLL
jgi:Glycosyl transferase family 2